MRGNTVERATSLTFPPVRPRRRTSRSPASVVGQKIMAQDRAHASKKITGTIKRIENVKKKLDQLNILCGTEGFIIYPCSNGLLSFPDSLDSILPLIEKYQTCIKSGLYKGDNVPKPLKPSKDAATLELELANRDHKLACISLDGREKDIKPHYTGLKKDDQESYLSKILHSISGNHKLDSFSVGELREILHQINSLRRTAQVKLKPLEFLEKSSKSITHGKETGNGEKEESHVAFPKQQHVLFDLLGKFSDGVKEDRGKGKGNVVPQTMTTKDKDKEETENYPFGQISKENFRFVFTGEQLQSLEFIGKLSNKTQDENSKVEEVHSSLGDRKEKETDEIFRPLKKGRGKGINDKQSTSMGKRKEKETDKVPYLTTARDHFRLFLSGDQIESLEVIGKLSSKVEKGDGKDDEEAILKLAL